MDKLDTSNDGGMPLELDDIEWMDAAYRDAWYGLISAFGITAPTSFKLSGCVVTKNGTIWTTTAGYICLEGEVLKVDAHSISVSNFYTAKWVLDISYDISNNEQFFNTNNYDTYQIRRGKLAQTAFTMPINYMPYNAKYLTDVIKAATVDMADIKNSIAAMEEDWHEVGGIGEPAFQNSWANVGGNFPNARFKKDVFGWVHFQIYITGGLDSTVAFTFPAGYLPADGSILYPAVLFDKSSAYIGISGSSGNITPNFSGTGGITCIGSFKAA